MCLGAKEREWEYVWEHVRPIRFEKPHQNVWNVIKTTKCKPSAFYFHGLGTKLVHLIGPKTPSMCTVKTSDGPAKLRLLLGPRKASPMQ